MSTDFALPTPLDYFRTLVQEDEGLPLLEAAASLAQDGNPDLDLDLVIDEMDLLAAKLSRRIPSDAPALQKLLALNHFFFRELNFGGNINDYYDQQNSFIHAVLRTRRGIPISLALIWLELAERIELTAYGVGFPGHFMIKVALPQGQVIIDPMTGQSLTREDLVERLGDGFLNILGGEDEDIPMGLFLQTASKREILERMLRNLQEIYAAQHAHLSELGVLNRLLILLPEPIETYRDRALLHEQLGDAPAAIGDLQHYLQHHLQNNTEADDADAIREKIILLEKKT